MKTSIEMQLKIIDKMRENVEKGRGMFEGIQYLDMWNEWCEICGIHMTDFNEYEFRIKPETITINGVGILKPLDLCDLEDEECYYLPSSIEGLHKEVSGSWCNCFKPKFVYIAKKEAIEASKALFGIEG